MFVSEVETSTAGPIKGGRVVFLCSRELGKGMRASGGGAIENISSINGVVAFPMRLAYSAAKSAVLSMTKILAVEWAAYGIRVNAVAPGNTTTEMLKEAMDQGLIDMDTYMAHTPPTDGG